MLCQTTAPLVDDEDPRPDQCERRSSSGSFLGSPARAGRATWASARQIEQTPKRWQFSTVQDPHARGWPNCRGVIGSLQDCTW